MQKTDVQKSTLILHIRFIYLFIFLFKKDPSLVKYIPDVINGLYKYTKGTINAEEALEQYSDVVTDYYNSIEDFDALVTEFWDTNIHKIKPFYFRQRQDDDIIISASPEVLLDDVMHRLNIKNYICSRTDGNAHITDLCFRGRKVELFKEMYPDTIIDNFYTDSVNDLKEVHAGNAGQEPHTVVLFEGNKIKQVK